MDGTMMMEEDMMNMDMGNMDMGDGVDGSLMHDHSNSTGGYGFCTGGMGMVMYMDGFRWALKRGQPCINLYFPGWTLNTTGKFVTAMIGVIILAILAEGISKFRHELSKKAKLSTLTKAEARNFRLTQTGLHGIHALTGYSLMLAAMTFALEFMVCVIMGLVIGYAIFGGDTYSHVTTNPCCAFLEDEANERILEAATRENNTPQADSDLECCQVGDSQEQATISDVASSIDANDDDDVLDS